MSLFRNISIDLPIEVCHLTKLFNQDTNPLKVNLSIEVYQDKNGTGLDTFCIACLKLILSEQSLAIIENRACSIQSLSGTSTLRIGLDFLYRNGFRNHESILQTVGFEIRKYRYWNKEKFTLDIDSFIADLESAS
ncbi:unnamed protein product [Rotaria sordida]|uniref:aspartate transaminase n=1 Tax=Rotaria sordida TaxID=392033 RepID=A0A814GD76_9BILA|nr:unnamed protein product [Rotaria sordida]CAF4002872.1 unnamed protein product [Rotaria sordida]